MKEIYTLAAQTKCGKTQAMQVLERFYENMSEEQQCLNKHDIAKLFSFFTPKATSKKAKSPIDWVNLAVSDDATRHYLVATYSDGEFLVATDGHRLHRIETDLLVGYYDKLGNAIDLDGTFPDYKRLIFDATGKVEVTLDIEKAKLDKQGKSWVYVFDVMGTPYVFKKKYVDDALNGKEVLKGHIDVNIESKDNKEIEQYILNAEVIYHAFQSEDKSIMLMPFRYNVN